MIKAKRGMSDIIVIVLIVFIAILAIVLLYGIVIPMIRESSQEIDINPLTNNIKLVENSIILNDSLSKLEFSVNRLSQENISFIQVIVSSNNKSLKYNLIDVPKNFESNSYLLDVSGINNIEEIFIYPVFLNEKPGIGERKIIEDKNKGEVNENLALIEPLKYAGNCVSDWVCGELSKCTLIYDLGNLLADEIMMKGEQTRICNDKNNCNLQIIERKECDDKSDVILKKVTEGGKDYVEVYDINNKLISKLEFIPGEHNVLNIELLI